MLQVWLYHKFKYLARAGMYTLAVAVICGVVSVSLLKYDLGFHLHHYSIGLLLWPWSLGRRRASSIFQVPGSLSLVLSLWYFLSGSLSLVLSLWLSLSIVSD